MGRPAIRLLGASRRADLQRERRADRHRSRRLSRHCRSGGPRGRGFRPACAVVCRHGRAGELYRRRRLARPGVGRGPGARDDRDRPRPGDSLRGSPRREPLLRVGIAIGAGRARDRRARSGGERRRLSSGPSLRRGARPGDADVSGARRHRDAAAEGQPEPVRRDVPPTARRGVESSGVGERRRDGAPASARGARCVAGSVRAVGRLGPLALQPGDADGVRAGADRDGAQRAALGEVDGGAPDRRRRRDAPAPPHRHCRRGTGAREDRVALCRPRPVGLRRDGQQASTWSSRSSRTTTPTR